MKKFILLCLVAFVSMTSYAQFYVGGTLGTAYGKTKAGGESVKQFVFMMQPELGYNIDNTLAVGASLGFGYGDNDDDTSTVLGISPYIRATFAQVKSVKFFAEGALFLNHTKDEVFDGDYSYNTYGGAVRPGFLVDMGSNIQLVGKATLFQYARVDDDDIDVKTWTIGIPNEFTIGLLVNF